MAGAIKDTHACMQKSQCQLGNTFLQLLMFKVIRVLCDKGREGVLQDTLINIQSFLFLFLLIGYVSSKYIVIKNSHSILLVHIPVNFTL